MNRFTNIDGDRFGGCLKHVFDKNVCLEARIRKSDAKICWIEFYTDGIGYRIYEPEE